MFCAYETFWLYNVIFSSVIYFLKNYLLFSKQKIIEMNRSSTHRSVSSNTRTSFTLWLTIIFVLTFIFLFQNVDGASLTANIGNQSKIFSRQTRENSFTVFNESESIGSIQNVNNTTANLSIHPEDEQFQDFMPDYIRQNGGVIVHFLILIYACLSLGIICDAYFLPSIEFIANSLSLPPDIAGATFMALGSSTPALAIALIGVFIAEDDIGTSTILGSSLFNLIFVSSVCGFAIYLSNLDYPKISKYAILRDAIFYLISITTLLLVLKDNEIDWFESISMLFVYGIYITILYYNAQINKLIVFADKNNTNEQDPLLDQSKKVRRTTFSTHQGPNWFEANRFLKILLFPMALAIKLTVPKPTKRIYFLTFALSVVWIGFFSYLDIWLVKIIGRTFKIPETVLGLTILAGGSSIPEVISSVIVVKRGSAGGHANMALCNLFGSNIFDILICLGLPWLLKSILTMINLGTTDMTLTIVQVQSGGLMLTAAALMLTVIAFVSSLAMFNWRLGLGMGFVCAIIYIVTITMAIVFEFVLNV